MAKQPTVSEYLAEIGKRGGEKKVPKGIAMLTPEQRKALAQQAAAKRWGTKKNATKKKPAK